MSPSTRVGPRDLGGVAMRLRAQGRVEAAVRWAEDPRVGKHGLKVPNLKKDVACNFRPPLLAGLGDWAGLAEWCRLYETEGWQLREWNSPTYTARVVAALAVGAAEAHGAKRAVIDRTLGRWLDLLALLAVPAPPLPLKGSYGPRPIAVKRRARWKRWAICPAGMRANTWTALDHGANGILAIALAGDPLNQARRAIAAARRHSAVPEDPARHVKPVRDLAAVTFAHCIPRLEGRGSFRDKTPALCAWRRDDRRLAALGSRPHLERIARSLAGIGTWGPLRVRIQRGRDRRLGDALLTVNVALSRSTSSNKGAVTAATISPESVTIQAVGPPGARSPQPRVAWTKAGCRAASRQTGIENLRPWMCEPEIDLILDRDGLRMF